MKGTSGDRLTLAVVEALGIRIAIDTTSTTPSPLARLVRSAWREHATPARAGHADRRVDLSVAADGPFEAKRALSALSTDVTLAALDALRGTRLLLHAAVVAAPDGRVIALVGPSGRGKTTAARQLGTRYGYVSDESVAVDDTLRVWPYRKPLSVIVHDEPHKAQLAPSDLGLLGLPSVPLRMAGIALLDRDPENGAPQTIAVDLIDAICDLVAQISYLPDISHPLRYVARVVEQVGGVARLRYRDAAELPPLVDAMFASSHGTVQEWTTPQRSEGTGPWRCAPVDDAILVDGRACILRGRVVTALGHRGYLVWSMCLAGAPTRTIADAAIAAFGPPAEGDASALIERTIAELAAHDLLVRA